MALQMHPSKHPMPKVAPRFEPLVNKTTIVFQANKYVRKAENLWKLPVVLGRAYFQKCVAQVKVINKRSLDWMFANSDVTFFLSENQKYLLSEDTELQRYQFGFLVPISAHEALKRFGLDTLENTLERTYCKL